jgi:hypothetical protein
MLFCLQLPSPSNARLIVLRQYFRLVLLRACPLRRRPSLMEIPWIWAHSCGTNNNRFCSSPLLLYI